jgi:hypothetical protein
MRALLLLAVLVEVAFSLGAGIYALLTGNTVAVPGAFVRLIAMAALGYFALRGHSRWPLWTFVTLEFMTAVGALALGIVWARKHGTTFEPTSLVIFAVFSALGLAAAIGGRNLRPEVAYDAVAP